MKRSMKGAAAAVLALTLGGSMGICAFAGENSYKVGIVKFMDHASLNQIEDSIKTELDKLSAENGTTYDYENYTYDGEGDGSVLNQIASSLMADEVDVIVAIATPAVQVMQAATEDTKIPITVADWRPRKTKEISFYHSHSARGSLRDEGGARGPP